MRITFIGGRTGCGHIVGGRQLTVSKLILSPNSTWRENCGRTETDMAQVASANFNLAILISNVNEFTASDSRTDKGNLMLTDSDDGVFIAADAGFCCRVSECR